VTGDFSTHLSPLDRSSRQKINKEILELHDTIDQMIVGYQRNKGENKKFLVFNENETQPIRNYGKQKRKCLGECL
jgi:hypothetical protein